MTVKPIAIKEITHANLETQELSIRALRSRLSSCLRWCQNSVRAPSAIANTGTIFKSETLKDAALTVFPFSCHTAFTGSLVAAFQDFSTLRNRLVRPSSTKVQETVAAVNRELQRPRSLLVTDWSASLFDGALEPDTRGFLDCDGMPPWDTWVDLIQVENSFGPCCLLSWVPEWLSNEVDFAIQADAAASLSWLMVDDDHMIHLVGWGTSWQVDNNSV